MATVRGIVIAGSAVRLVRVDGTGEALDAQAGGDGRFEVHNVAAGWYILTESGSYWETAKAVRVDADTDLGAVRISPPPPLMGDRKKGYSTPVLTVCEAFASGYYGLYQAPAVIVGIFKSGMDETLRLDCPSQLMSGELGWPSSIGLTRPTQPPDELRDEIEKKRAEILKSGPPGAQPRPERVVALYGIFVSLSGLTAAPCCHAAVETAIPPARLFGIGERDFRDR